MRPTSLIVVLLFLGVVDFGITQTTNFRRQFFTRRSDTEPLRCAIIGVDGTPTDQEDDCTGGIKAKDLCYISIEAKSASSVQYYGGCALISGPGAPSCEDSANKKFRDACFQKNSKTITCCCENVHECNDRAMPTTIDTKPKTGVKFKPVTETPWPYPGPNSICETGGEPCDALGAWAWLKARNETENAIPGDGYDTAKHSDIQELATCIKYNEYDTAGTENKGCVIDLLMQGVIENRHIANFYKGNNNTRRKRATQHCQTDVFIRYDSVNKQVVRGSVCACRGAGCATGLSAQILPPQPPAATTAGCPEPSTAVTCPPTGTNVPSGGSTDGSNCDNKDCPVFTWLTIVFLGLALVFLTGGIVASVYAYRFHQQLKELRSVTPPPPPQSAAAPDQHLAEVPATPETPSVEPTPSNLTNQMYSESAVE